MTLLSSGRTGFALVIAGILAALWSSCQTNLNASLLGLPALWAGGVVLSSTRRTSGRALASAAVTAVVAAGLVCATLWCWSTAFAWGTGWAVPQHVIDELLGRREQFEPIAAGAYVSIELDLSAILAGVFVLVVFTTAVWLLRRPGARAARAGAALALVPLAWQLVTAISLGHLAYALAAAAPGVWLAARLRRRSKDEGA